MRKQVIRLTESDIHQMVMNIVEESLKDKVKKTVGKVKAGAKKLKDKAEKFMDDENGVQKAVGTIGSAKGKDGKIYKGNVDSAIDKVKDAAKKLTKGKTDECGISEARLNQIVTESIKRNLK